MNEKLTSICGLDCKKCGAYIALKNNDNELRKKTAKEWSAAFGHDIPAENVNCVGCCVTEGIHGGYCHACPLRACALSKNMPNCYVCPEFYECKNCKDFDEHSGMKIEDNFLAK